MKPYTLQTSQLDWLEVNTVERTYIPVEEVGNRRNRK